MATNPDILQFASIPGLALRGLLQGFEVGAAVEPGVIWMRANLPTHDVETGAPTWIVFTTPYPPLPIEWIIADFLAWVLTHEMREGSRLQGLPLYDVEDLALDHERALLTDTWIAEKLQRATSRFRDDHRRNRWARGFRHDDHVLFDALAVPKRRR